MLYNKREKKPKITIEFYVYVQSIIRENHFKISFSLVIELEQLQLLAERKMVGLCKKRLEKKNMIYVRSE